MPLTLVLGPANSAKAGTTVGTANTYQALDFESPVEVLTPGKYFGSVIYNGHTATLRTAIVDGLVAGTVNSASDFSAAPINITAPSAAGGANVSPQGFYLY